MNSEDINRITTEISALKDRGIVLSEGLDVNSIMSEYETIEYQSSKGRYVLPKMYSLIKRIQKCINASLYGNDISVFIPLFSIAEEIRRRLGQEYQKRAEIISKVRNIKKLINEESTV
jgi:hypothetical protein